MNKPVCPSCGSPNVELIERNKYQCPYCGTTFSDNSASPVPPVPPTEVNAESNTETEDETPTNVYSIIGWIFYLIGIVDFCGMFFDYDFTGVSWSPIAFAGIGYIFDWLAKKNA